MNLIKERGGCDILPGSVFVQSLQMKRWISSTVSTTVAHQPPTLTTLPRRAPLAPPTLLPTHTCTHTRTRINTLPLCQPPARTRLPKHTGPTGTHTLCLFVQPPLPSAPSTVIHLMFPLPFPLSLFCSFTLFPHNQGQRDWMACSGLSLFFISVPFYVQYGLHHFRPFSHQLMGSFKCFLDCTALIYQIRDTWNKKIELKTNVKIIL